MNSSLTCVGGCGGVWMVVGVGVCVCGVDVDVCGEWQDTGQI